MPNFETYVGGLATATTPTGAELFPGTQGGAPKQFALSSMLGTARTAAEIAAGVVPVNYVYVPGITDRYLANTTPGTTDMSGAFALALPLLIVTAEAYRVSTNTTVTADLRFDGGYITVDTGVTLTINGSINAPSQVIFKGLGTVIVNRGEIDVAWFDGTDASSKWNFCKRGISNNNGLGKIVVFSKPATTDAWAAVATSTQWGPRWRVDAPIVVLNAQQATVFRTPAGFVATTAMNWVWQFESAGSGVKCDFCHFPDKLSIDGNGTSSSVPLAQYAMRFYGASHARFPHLELYHIGGILMQPSGTGQTISACRFGHIDTGELQNAAVLTVDGSAAPGCSITDIDIDFISSTGFFSGYAPNAVVQLSSNYNAIRIGKVAHTALSPYVDPTGTIVSVANNGATAGVYYPPSFGVVIGPITNNTPSSTVPCVQLSDGSGATATKFNGVTIQSGSVINSAGTPQAIKLYYANNTIVQGASSLNAVFVDSTCSDTQIYGAQSGSITDNGVGTLVNGIRKESFTWNTVTATFVVTDALVTAACKITLTPTNAAAATLIGSAKCPYVSAKTAGASFTLSTASAGTAAGTETFDYAITF